MLKLLDERTEDVAIGNTEIIAIIAKIIKIILLKNEQKTIDLKSFFFCKIGIIKK